MSIPIAIMPLITKKEDETSSAIASMFAPLLFGYLEFI